MQTIGIMSGTSLDAADAVLCSFDKKGQLHLQAAASLPIPPSLKTKLWELTQTKHDEIKSMLVAERQITHLYVQLVESLVKQSNIKRETIAAIGCHGQTIRHQMIQNALYTLQIGDIHLLSATLGIPCIGDFRRADIALGGQGAPLLPAFHAEVFHSPSEDRAVVNLGGIANITLLPKDTQQTTIGFDTGPGNGLMDNWVMQCWHKPYDKDGAIAQKGQVIVELLDRCLADSYFSLPPPKSTGRDYFHLDWLNQKMNTAQYKQEDILATLLSLTAHAIKKAIAQHQPATQQLILCGGGAYNKTLVNTIAQLMPGLHVVTTRAHGFPPEWVEACGFAWLAYRRLLQLHGNLPSVTGARQGAILGTLCVP